MGRNIAQDMLWHECTHDRGLLTIYFPSYGILSLLSSHFYSTKVLKRAATQVKRKSQFQSFSAEQIEKRLSSSVTEGFLCYSSLPCEYIALLYSEVLSKQFAFLVLNLENVKTQAELTTSACQVRLQLNIQGINKQRPNERGKNVTKCHQPRPQKLISPTGFLHLSLCWDE